MPTWNGFDVMSAESYTPHMPSSKQTPLGVEEIGFWLPPDQVDNLEVGKRHDFPEDFITEKLGIQSRHQLSGSLGVSDMAASAIQVLLSDAEASADEIEFLALVTQTGDFSLPHTSAIVQEKAGLPETAFVFDISLGCSGFVMGLDIAIGTMERLGLDRGILVTADAYTKIVDPNDRSTSPLFGDAAAATLLSRSAKWTMGQSAYGSRGILYDKLIVRGSGSAGGRQDPLYMDGRAILDFTRKAVPESVENVLKVNGLSPEDVDHFVFHQANGFVLDTLTRDLELDAMKVVRSFSDIGNTTSSSVPIALKREIIDSSSAGNVVLVSGFGVGLSWSSSVLFRAQT